MYDPEKVTYFAETDARNKRVKFGIKAKDRVRHFYVIGKTGMGKSTLLENMAVQDIQSGEGIAFIDPHGKTADLFLDYVPEERIKDVIYFAPFDTDNPIAFNVMEDVGPSKRHLVANGLMSAFKKIWVDAWSARMEYILNNTILALLEYPDSTLIGVNRMLSDKAYRKMVVANISDPSVKSFWVDEFEKYGERYMQEAGAAIQNKVGQFISNPLVRNIIGQPKSTFDFRDVMDQKKIVIVNLSKGQVGEQNANLLGSMIITKIYLAALSRADIPEKVLQGMPNFYLYVDEFQSFANESFADILSEARKYKLNLTIAHQYVEQMSEEVRAAVFGNVGTMASFRVGAIDAELLEKEFAPTFTAEDMVNLGKYQIYLKLMIDGMSSQPFSATNLPPIALAPRSYREEIIAASRLQFTKPRTEVDEAIRAWHGDTAKKEEKPIRDKDHATSYTPSTPSQPSASSAPRSAQSFDKKPRFDEKRDWNTGKDLKKEKKAMFEAIMEEEKQKEVVAPFVPKPISLQSLKPTQKVEEKKPTPQHVSELKKALESLTRQKPAQSFKQTPPAVQQKQEQKKEHTPHSGEVHKPKEEKHHEQAEPKLHKEEEVVKKKKVAEIPEDDLRKMLEVKLPE